MFHNDKTKVISTKNYSDGLTSSNGRFTTQNTVTKTQKESAKSLITSVSSPSRVKRKNAKTEVFGIVTVEDEEEEAKRDPKKRR